MSQHLQKRAQRQRLMGHQSMNDQDLCTVAVDSLRFLNIGEKYGTSSA